MALLGLPFPGSGMPLAENERSPGAPRPPLPTHSGGPALPLNWGLKVQKIQGQSQGKGWPAEGQAGASVKSRLRPASPAAPTHAQLPGSPFWSEALSGSRWLGPGLADVLPLGPGLPDWEDSPLAHADPDLLASALTPPVLWPSISEKALAGPSGHNDSKELLDVKMGRGLTAALGNEESKSSSPGGRHPLRPGLGLRASEDANTLGHRVAGELQKVVMGEEPWHVLSGWD